MSLRKLRWSIGVVWIGAFVYLTYLNPATMLTFMAMIGALSFAVLTAFVFSAEEER
jgi:hypothetical protein